ncbi:MAG TPA: hypothetical protein VLD13_11085 [Gaiellaceae bacterium]|nr:hypothetical protein [Gaiellaceae bacterium]
MHEGEIETDVAFVRRLLASKFPQWAGPPVEPVRSSGTGNALYRLGGELVVPPPAREDLRERLGVDDATWARGRGRALSIGVTALPYYRARNPAGAAVGGHPIREVLSEATA